ncbi:Predicted dehydrogenase [Klenkia marina]|uniref:Predicted dehydrogenase n=1 Tax=Klenkia marina TaxID=1960309 RepID=A0A1G4Z1R6_9ACTN|nr:Gfo/Idh/MocA family oxidoreductase [Klenkia marina]SCX59620.1 Predicted dehydrogenase [Klenkia marina]
MGDTRVALVGAGHHAQVNLVPALRAAGVEIGALATRDVDRSRAGLTRAGAAGTPYGSVEALLVGEPDLTHVVVCAQPADQPGIVETVLRAGRNVLCEKPVGADAGQARRLADLAADAGVVLRAAFMKRHAPALVELRSIIASGRYGAPVGFDVRFAADARAFAPDVRSFLTLAAVHHVDLVPFLLGAPLDVVASATQHGVGETLRALLTTAPGVHGTLRLSSLPAYSSEVDVVEVEFERAVVRVTDTRTTETRLPGSGDWRAGHERVEVRHAASSTMSGGEQDLHLRGFVGELAAFAATLVAPDGSAEENVVTMQLVDRLLAAAGVPPG